MHALNLPPPQIIEQKKAERVGAAMMGSTHTYDLGKKVTKGRCLHSVAERI